MEDYTIEGTFCHLFIEPQKTYWERTVVYRFTNLACDTDFIEKNYEWNMVFLYRDVCGWEMFDIKSIFMCVQEEEDYAS